MSSTSEDNSRSSSGSLLSPWTWPGSAH